MSDRFAEPGNKKNRSRDFHCPLSDSLYIGFYKKLTEQSSLHRFECKPDVQEL